MVYGDIDMTYEYHNETIGNYTLRVVADDEFYGWEHHLCEEPVQLAYRERFNNQTVFDNTSTDIPGDIWKAIESEEWCDIAESLAYMCEDRGPDKIVVFPYWYDQCVTFKSWENAARGMFKREYGFDLSDVKVERFDTQSESYFMIWRQSELDTYAGVKNAKPPSATVRAVLDGDIWGYTITDRRGDVVGSCWSFEGAAEYCLSEGRGVVYHMVERDKKERFERLKNLIRNRVPLALRGGLLA